MTPRYRYLVKVGGWNAAVFAAIGIGGSWSVGLRASTAAFLSVTFLVMGIFLGVVSAMLSNHIYDERLKAQQKREQRPARTYRRILEHRRDHGID